MMQLLKRTGVILTLAMACVACDQAKPPQSELQKPTAASGQAASQDRERSEFGQAAQKELDELRAAITELRAKAAAANAQTQARLGQQADKLELEWRDAQQRLLELKSATVESWQQMKESFGKTITGTTPSPSARNACPVKLRTCVMRSVESRPRVIGCAASVPSARTNRVGVPRMRATVESGALRGAVWYAKPSVKVAPNVAASFAAEPASGW